MINFCLYADPTDGPSSFVIPIISQQFPTAVLCTTFSEVETEIDKPGTWAVLVLPRQSGEFNPVEITKAIWLKEVQILTNKNTQVVLFLTEIEIINQENKVLSQIPNLLIVAPAQHTFGMLHYPWVIWQHWLQDAVNVYQKPGLKSYIDTFVPGSVRPMLFDVLLGGERPYRTLLHDWIENDPVLASQIVMTYYGGNSARPRMILEPGMTEPDDRSSFHFAFPCQFEEVNTRAGVIPPVSIYQQSAYSIVTETTAELNYVFFTEKIARPIVCQRLFIVLSSHGYLHYLRAAGFQTFSEIINESYDLEVNDTRRWRMAFEQMQVLADMDQQTVLERIQPIVEHNRRVLLETDWHKKMSQQVGQILESRLWLNLKPA
jgi:hypothetical protein